MPRVLGIAGLPHTTAALLVDSIRHQESVFYTENRTVFIEISKHGFGVEYTFCFFLIECVWFLESS